MEKHEGTLFKLIVNDIDYNLLGNLGVKMLSKGDWNCLQLLYLSNSQTTKLQTMWEKKVSIIYQRLNGQRLVNFHSVKKRIIRHELVN